MAREIDNPELVNRLKLGLAEAVRAAREAAKRVPAGPLFTVDREGTVRTGAGVVVKEKKKEVPK